MEQSAAHARPRNPIDGRRRRLLEGGVLLALAAASSLWCLAAARAIGPTFDEPAYLRAGLAHWQTGSYRELMRMGTMPLAVDLETLPVHLWQRSPAVRFDPARDTDTVLPMARAANLVFWWIVLAYGWLAARSLAGAWAGMLAAALLAIEPVLLGHAALATTDLAVAACVLALVYHFRTARDAPWRRRVGLPALWFAAATLAKVSGLFFAVLCLAAVELERLWPGPPPGGGPGVRARLRRWLELLRPLRRDLGAILGYGLLVVFVYCGSDWRAEPSFVRWAQSLPEGSTTRAVTLWTATNLRIFGNAGEAIVRQIRHNLRGQGPHGTYLLGQVGRAFWYYYPVAVSIKLSLPPMILAATVAALRPKALWNWANVAAASLLVLSLFSRLQIGIRLVLPMVVLGIVGIAAAVVRAACESAPGWRGRLLAVEAVAAIAWTAVSAVAVWPNGICYTNQAWGGTPRGYLYLSDSNYDWGQGLSELALWQQRHRIPTLEVWYFGTDPVLRSRASRDFPLERMRLKEPADVAALLRGRYLAASTTMLYGPIVSPAQLQVIEFLRRRRPVARTTTFLIYDFTEAGNHRPAE